MSSPQDEVSSIALFFQMDPKHAIYPTSICAQLKVLYSHHFHMFDNASTPFDDFFQHAIA